MARRVFFSFHFERDIWRVNQVRNSWLTKPNRQVVGYWDASLWEKTRLQGDAAIKRLIDEGLQGTSVTAVLIGAETASRKYVEYEISESQKRGNGIVGVYINTLPDALGRSDYKGLNPLSNHYVIQQGRTIPMSQLYLTYDWKRDSGYDSFGMWVEYAAQSANR